MYRNDWLNRTTNQLYSNTPPEDMKERYPAESFVDVQGAPQSNAGWVYDPDLSAVTGQPSKYWIITGDVVSLMNQAARDAVDVAEAAAVLASNRADAISMTVEPGDFGIKIRELIELFNKRDNYLTTRILELQSALGAVKATSGPADNIRTAIPGSFLATATRTRAAAIADFTADINAGGAD